MRLTAAVAIASATAVACVLQPSPSPSPSLRPSPTHSVRQSPSPTATGTAGGTPTASPEAPLSLAAPARTDRRQVRVQVSADVPASGTGQVTIHVQSLADRRVKELVLRFPTELAQTVFLAPFEPSEARIAEFGPPLYQEWTKWVIGPGESGEPDGTTSIGWGPLDPGATLTIPLVATRNAPGAVAFDLQILARERILTLPSGEPAELRVRIPG